MLEVAIPFKTIEQETSDLDQELFKLESSERGKKAEDTINACRTGLLNLGGHPEPEKILDYIRESIDSVTEKPHLRLV